jgi:hypothetical protein
VARQAALPRKRRTQQHIIADLSVHHVEGYILREGHTAQRVEKDYGYDLFLYTYDEQGYIEPGLAYLQLKASETLEQTGADYVFDVDIRDYNLWMLERFPVFLVLFDASRRKAYWLWVQRYFHDDQSRRHRKGAKTVRVRLPARQTVSRRGIRRMCQVKRAVFTAAKTEGSHD